MMCVVGHTVILAPPKCRQLDHKFKASLDQVARSFLKKKKIKLK
jgi:hypothetical protein